MKKLLPILTLVLASVTSVTYAQTDTTKLDLGRITVQKQFTQSVTVKGADLQKLPFTTLSDAVNTWFYGVYGTASYVTVIDGNLMADINAYSVFDIDEITLVQNSLTQLNGISPSQILLLVKTKRAGRGGKSGIDVNGQLNYVNLRNTGDGGKSTANMYHQYYISPYVNTESVNAGLSAGFQRSVLPGIENDVFKVDRPFSLTRVKLNAYADVKLSKEVLLSVNSGYVPQTDTLGRITSIPYSSQNQIQSQSSHANHYLWYGEVKLHANITRHLTNRFSASMQLYDNYSDQNANATATNYFANSESNVSSKKKNFLIKDDLSYRFTSGDWTIEPNVNFTYREFRNGTVGDAQNIAVYNMPGGGTNISGGSMTYWTSYKANAALLTPSLSVSLAKAFLVQGGFQYFIRNAETAPFGVSNPSVKPKLFPFVSVSANILRSDLGEDPNTSLTMFGSFAKSMANMSDQNSQLTDGVTSFANISSSGYFPGSGSPYYLVYDVGYNPYRTFDQMQAGATLSLLKQKIQISYNYSIRKNDISYPIAYYSSGGSTYYSYLYPDQRVDLHRLSFDIRGIKAGDFTWTTGINTSVAKTDVKFSYTGGLDPFYLRMFISNVTSGGFINRFTYKKLSAGLDVLYRINEDVYSPMIYTVDKDNVNSFDLKNLYFAYQLSPKWAKSTQLFANARNLIQNKQSTITDNRRYYGLGFMLTL